MGAIIKACLSGNAIKNTGKECDIAMGPTAMLIAMPQTTRFTDEDLVDLNAWMEAKMHLPLGQRVYPFFGQAAPIRTITNSSESDVIVTLDDGLQIFLRYGIYNRTLETTSGGLCYARALQTLKGSGYALLEIDNEGKMLVHKYSPGVYGGVHIDFMYAPSPILADFKTTPYKNRFQYSFSPVEMVSNCEVLSGADGLLSLIGLIDSTVVDGSAATVPSGQTSASRDITITDPGDEDDTIDIMQELPVGDDVSLTGGPVTATATETTNALLATKIKDAINAATSTNGGITATVNLNVITLVFPLGETKYNLTQTPPVIVGTITTTSTVVSEAVVNKGKVKARVITDCAETDLVALFGSNFAHLSNFIIIDTEDDTVFTMDSVAIVNNEVEFTGSTVSGQTLKIKAAEPSVWLGNGISGYDGLGSSIEVLIP